MTIGTKIAAGIDLGSNTFRLLIAEYSSNNIKVLVKKLASVGLGRGLLKEGRLQTGVMQKGLEVLESFRKDLDQFRPENIKICGTEALRRAGNSQEFLQMAAAILNSEIHIISGEEEAHLSLAGALSGYDDFTDSLLLVDVGGGSTEFVLSDTCSGKITVESIDLGVVGLTETFFSDPEYRIAALDFLLMERIGSALAELQHWDKNQAVHIVGCGGTATSLAALGLGLATYDSSRVHGHILPEHILLQLWNRLIKLSAEERNRLPCLGQGRGEILPAGLRIYQTLLKLLNQKSVRVSDSGLLEGILLSSVSDIMTK